jgi:hypothetical protein
MQLVAARRATGVARGLDEVVAVFVVVVLGGLAGCRADNPGSRESEATSSGVGTAAGADDWFVDRARHAGLDFVYFNGSSGAFYFPEMLPGGVALFDYDNDGDLDVYFAQGEMLGTGKTPDQAFVKPPAAPLRGRLYRNDLGTNGPLKFTDVTDESGIDARGYGMGVAAADYDNDGCIDLYLTYFGQNRLYRNTCRGSFTDVSKESGTDSSGWSVSASFFDYDRDGWLDLYVGNYVQYTLETDQPCTGLTGRRDFCTPKVYTPQPDRLYRNLGNGRFADVTGKALAGGPFGPALGISTADFNGDGWIDVYVTNDGKENVLWINQKDGTFRNNGLLAGAALSAEGKPEASMGVDAGDFDNDGDEDLYMTHLPAEGNNLYVNNGAGLFEDRSASSALGPLSLGYSGFGTAWLDIDNDGWLDLVAVNGAIEAAKDRLQEKFPYDERSLVFRNLADGRFENVTAMAGSVFSRPAISRGAAFGDVDNDGDIDVVVSQIDSPARLLVNTIGNKKHWVGIRLIGARTPRDMLGARVQLIKKDGSMLWRRARSDGSYGSANDPRVLAGLGDVAAAPRLRVRWPAGAEEEWPEIAIDRWTTITEGTGSAVR